ncbi:MAG: hypothetical protein HOC74_40095 [Gemmatimonadetes bacterium]|jgi:hypothetical protein|nr:hypothetical protein [Gemmatimonadota bacterium]
MANKTLCYGIQKAAEGLLEEGDLRTTVAQQIEKLLEGSGDGQISAQVRAALKDPQSVIEIRSGGQVQTATPDMPLREVLSPESGELEITVSKPHVGG